MPAFASNTPISRPCTGTGFKADVDFGGIMFSYKDGFGFPDGSGESIDPIVLPPTRRSTLS